MRKVSSISAEYSFSTAVTMLSLNILIVTTKIQSLPYYNDIFCF